MRNRLLIGLVAWSVMATLIHGPGMLLYPCIWACIGLFFYGLATVLPVRKQQSVPSVSIAPRHSLAASSFEEIDEAQTA